MDVAFLSSRPPDLHGSSVGEASARHTCHCPPASKDVRQGVPGTPGLRVSLMWLRSSDLSRRAVLKLGTSGGIRQQSLAIVGHFFRSGEMVSRLASNSSPERHMEPNDDQPPSTGDTAW